MEKIHWWNLEGCFSSCSPVLLMLRHLFFISAHKFVSTNVTPSPLTSGSLELISAASSVCLLRYYKHYAFFLSAVQETYIQ